MTEKRRHLVRRWLVFSLVIGTLLASPPAWIYFATRWTTLLLFPRGWSEDAIVYIAHSVIALPYFCGLGAAAVWACCLAQDSVP